MSTLERLSKYRADYIRFLKRKATDPLVVEPDRKQFPDEIQRFVDEIRKQVEEDICTG